MAQKNKTSILIIAAGSSSRLGSPKQLVDFHGKKLINHVLETCKASEVGEVFMVLGANSELIRREIKEEDCTIFQFDNWQEGMSSTIAFGVSQIFDKKPENILFVLSDQPYITVDLLQELNNKIIETKSPAVLSRYMNRGGPPAIFSHRLYDELMKLKGDDGAKEVVNRYKEEVMYVDFPLGDIDIDTRKDVEDLKSHIIM